MVRTLPLGADFYAAVGFMQTVSADGGGDLIADYALQLPVQVISDWQQELNPNPPPHD